MRPATGSDSGESGGVHVPGQVGGGDRARVDRVGGDAVAGPAPGRLNREQDIRGLRLAVRQPRVVRAGWLANLDARPELTLHLEGPVRADLPAHARIIEDESERRRILAPIALSWRRNDSGLWADEAGPDIETMVRMSPLIEVTLDRAA